MSKNYMAAFQGLSEKHKALQQAVLPLGQIHDLESVKDKICNFELPQSWGASILEIWNNLNKIRKILDDVTKSLTPYKEVEEKENTSSSTLGRQELHVKVADMMIIRYQQDLSFIMNDLSFEALLQAIKEGKEDLVTVVIQSNPGVIERVDVDEWGPIHVCAHAGNNKILEILVKTFKVDVNQKTAYGNTPMHIAAENGKVDTLLALKKLGADSNATNRGGQSVIDILDHHNVAIQRSIFEQIFPHANDDLSSSDDFSVTVSGGLQTDKSFIEIH